MLYEVITGEDKVMAFATTELTGWTVCMTAYDSELAETATTQAYVLTGIGVVVAILLASIITFISKRLIVRPVLEIEAFTKRIADQDYKA